VKSEVKHFAGSRQEVREQTVTHSLQVLLELLSLKK
jgi:nicotinamide mononucleotide (NMN) deamidase PncC